MDFVDFATSLEEVMVFSLEKSIEVTSPYFIFERLFICCVPEILLRSMLFCFLMKSYILCIGVLKYKYISGRYSSIVTSTGSIEILLKGFP